MTLGTVPVIAISTFAANEETTADTAAVDYKDLSTVSGLTNDQNDAVKAVIDKSWTKDSGDAIATAVKEALDGKNGYVVNNVKTTSLKEITNNGLPALQAIVDVTGTSRDGAEVDGNDWNATVTITVDKATDAEKDIEKNIPAILANYFATHKIAYGSNIAAVQKQLDDVKDHGLFDSIRSKDALSIDVTAVDASKANQAGSVALTVKLAGKGAEEQKDGKGTGKFADLTKDLTYTPEVDDELTRFEDAIKAAAKYISDNNLTLADYDAGKDGYLDYVYVQDGQKDYSQGTPSDDEETVFYGRIASLINKALNDQGIYNIDVTAKNLSEIIVDKPTATENGRVKGVVYALDRKKGEKVGKGIDFSVALTYSDDAKLKDAKAEMNKDLEDSYTSSSALAQKIQANGSGVAASNSVIAAEVKSLLPDGYNVYVKSNKPATFTTEGEAKVTVTYTVANDWYDDTQVANQGNDGKTNAKYKTVSKDITISLSKLKKVVLRQIDLGADTTFRRSFDNEEVKKIYLNKTLTPADANDGIADLQWTSSDPSVATVDENGVVTPVSTGSVKITARSKTDPGIYDSVTITIQKGFDDVQNTAAFYYNPVYDAADNGITSGVSETVFGRNNSVTRGQFLTWLYKIATKYYGYSEVANGAETTQFSDVKADKFYAKAVTWAVQNGITSGTTATTFSPNATITRAQAVTMMWRLAGSEPYTYDNTFSDVASNKWYAEAVQWAVANKVTSGNTTNTFNPNGTATRAQAITFLANGFGDGWHAGHNDNVHVDQ